MMYLLLLTLIFKYYFIDDSIEQWSDGCEQSYSGK